MRLVYVVQLRASPYGIRPIVDALAYDQWGWRIAQGQLSDGGVFYQSPFYPYFLGLVYAFVGHEIFPVQLLQCLMGALSCVLAFFLTRRLFNDQAGVAAGILAAFYLPYIFFDGLLLKGTVTIFVLFAGLVLFFESKKRLEYRWILGAGFLFGIGVLNRGNFLLCIPLAVYGCWVGAERAKRLWRVGFFILGFSGAVLPATLHNAWVGDDFVLVSYTGGINFYEGNNPMASGVHLPAPHIRTVPKYEENDARAYAERQEGRVLKPSEIESFWYREGLRFIWNSPRRAFKLIWSKFIFFINTYEVPDNYNLYFMGEHGVSFLRLPFFTFGVLLPLAIVGFVFRKKTSEQWLVATMAVVYGATVVLFYVTARYRLPITVFLLPFSGAGAVELFNVIRSKKIKACCLRLGVFLFFAAAGHAAMIPAEFSYAREYDVLASLLKKEDPVRARAVLEDGLRWAKAHGRRNAHVAALYVRMGREYENSGERGEAMRYYREAAEMDPQNAQAHYKLSEILEALGLSQKARAAREHALLANPSEVLEMLLSSGAHMALAGKYKSAETVFRRAIAINPLSANAHYLLGNVLKVQKRYSAAEASYERALKIAPDHAGCLRSLSFVRAQQGKSVRASP